VLFRSAGGSGDDTILGSAGRDEFYGNDGDDLFVVSLADLEAGEGYCGNLGNDTLFLTDGDSLPGGITLNSIETTLFGGGSGADVLAGNEAPLTPLFSDDLPF